MTDSYEISTRAGLRHTGDPQPDPPMRQTQAGLRRDGLLCFAGGVIAMVGTAWGTTQAVPAADAIISAPQSPGTFRLLELVWTLTHVLTLFGALGLARSGVAEGRGGRLGGRLAVLGMALIIPGELAFIPFARSTDSDLGPMLASTAIGLASLVAGAGFLLAGVAVLRTRTWPGPARFLPLLTGLWVFVGLTPLVIADGRAFYVGIGLWNLLLALLGLALAGRTTRT